MTALELSIATSDIARHCTERLRNGATSPDVVWQTGTRRILLRPGTLVVRSLEGWLLINLDVESDSTGRATLQFVFSMGKRDSGNGVQAACTINAPTPQAAQLADAWGRDLQRVLWDAVLDGVEACVARAAAQTKTPPVTLAGFFTDAQSVIVTVLAGV